MCVCVCVLGRGTKHGGYVSVRMKNLSVSLWPVFSVMAVIMPVSH